MPSTQILVTIGPASRARLAELVKAGISGIRLNSSHGDFGEHAEIISGIRRESGKIFVVYDIKGPKIRLGDLPDPLPLKAGMKLILLSGEIPEKTDSLPGETLRHVIPVGFDRFHEFVRPGHRLLIDDGLIGLKVTAVQGRDISAEVLYGDVLRSRKGINHPDTVIDFPYTAQTDIPGIEFAIKENVDFIADSFVRNADDVEELRGRLLGTAIRIISKIENPEGVNNFDGILEKTDAVMIARGDLGVEFEPWEIPEIQKTIIEKCGRAGKPVITATQLLESMLDNPRPSRSDVSDIANTIYDGTDLLMLSGETSVGKYPVLAVDTMRKIIETTEAADRFKKKKKIFCPLFHL